MKFKRILGMILVVLMVFSLLACNPKPDDSVNGDDPKNGEKVDITTLSSDTIKIWAWSEGDLYNVFASDFPDLVLDYQIASDNNLGTLSAAIAAGNQPDVFRVDFHPSAPIISAYYNKLIEPLNKYLENDPDYNYDSLPEKFWEMVTFEGNTCALFTDVTVYGLFWNKDLFANAGLDPDVPPKNWTQMREYAEKLTVFDSTGVPVQIGFRGMPPFWALLGSYKSYVVTDDGLGARADTPEFEKSLEYAMSFPEIYGGEAKIPPTRETRFHAGNVAMWIEDILSYQITNVALGSDVNFGIAPVPKPDDFDEEIVTSYLWQWYGIPRGAKNPNGGWLFMKWLLTEGVYQYNYGLVVDNPDRWFPLFIAHKDTRDRLYADALDQVDENIAELILERDAIGEKINYSTPLSVIHSDWDAKVNEYFEKINKGELSIKDGLKELQQIGEAIHSDWRK